ncbi:hypothetical protein PUNSTDRAFT_44784 [Punctularia strigosozonata HHB-11173 SS5]|uniref:uncharacterized protein n=1 Tax=Punctularia strigosozonata (strain HHB-11173) TaxID=741275 RepID=UPI000441736C|nr:uncharacterized protein PUNSTDRAFT_44784 [Punctularia strigosozonata HHB-11173 SS5]EIN08218.1 hypothetical protein PUNSTDRAFT_44784 [Punctularia strigosozonata HHB-11173 SS5]
MTYNATSGSTIEGLDQSFRSPDIMWETEAGPSNYRTFSVLASTPYPSERVPRTVQQVGPSNIVPSIPYSRAFATSAGEMRAGRSTVTDGEGFRASDGACTNDSVSFTSNLRTTGPHASAANRAKKFQCPHAGCQSSYTTKANLISHLDVHAGIKKFECAASNCRSRFTRRSDLKRHEKIHEPNREAFVCHAEGCEKQFSRLDSLRSHQNTTRHHAM